MRWTGDGWKEVLTQYLREKLAGRDGLGSGAKKANPLAKITKDFFQKDVTVYWQWEQKSIKNVNETLEKLLNLRNEIIHERFTGRQQNNRARDIITVAELSEYAAFIQKLADVTINALAVQDKSPDRSAS